MKNAEQKSPLLKKIILIALGCMLLSGCALVVLYGHIWPDMKALQQVDLTECSVQEYADKEQSTREAQLHLSAEEQAQLRAWLQTLKGMSVDHVSYAPALYLRGKGFCILFRQDSLVVNFSAKPEDPTHAVMRQVSRRLHPEDKRMADWLRSKLPAELPTPPCTP